MTRRKYSNQWNGCIEEHTDPKISSAKIHSKSCRLDFLVSRRHLPHWLPSNESKYQYGVLINSAEAIEGYFEGKMRWEAHQSTLVVAQHCPDS